MIILEKKTQNNIIQIGQKFLTIQVEGSESGKTNALLNLINHEPYIDKNVLYTKDPYEA